MRAWIAALFVSLCLASAAAADTRVALVIGNSAYDRVGALPNPRNDAAMVADVLNSEGFKVTLVQDATRVAMVRAANLRRRGRSGRLGASLLRGPRHRGGGGQLFAADRR